MGDVDTAPDAASRAREADAPRNSLVARFGADRPLQARRRRRAVAVPDRLPDLRHAQRRAHQRGAGLPRADRRPACRQRPSGHRQARLVGDHGRPRQADRHRALLRHLPERARRLHGHDRAGLDQSRRPASRGASNFPVITIRDMVRAQAMLLDHLGIDTLFCGRRRLDGRHAGAAMGGELSRARVLRRCRSPARRGIRRRTSPSTRSAARR